jgi:hypothetical protein
MRLLFPFLIALLILSASISGCVDEKADSTDEEMNRILKDSIWQINDELNRLTEATEENAALLSRLGPDSPEAIDSLRGWLRTFSYAESSIVIGSDGVVIAAVPEHYHQIVGMDLSYQPAVQRANTIQGNIVSDLFWLVEGFFGISQSSPIFSSDGEYLGYTDITYRPEMMIGHEITPILAKTSYDIWVTDTNGIVLYDTTAEEIGRNLFSDPAYQSPGLQEAFSVIVSEKSGKTEYTFWDRNWGSQVTKTALWGTAGIHGAEWRVVITRSDSDDKKTMPGTDSSAVSEEDINSMRAFVAEAVAYAREHGKEAAVTAFNDPKGQFIREGLYIFAYEMDGTNLALPYQPGLIGENRRGITDANGVLFIDGLIWTAETGGGNLYYVYPNPERGYAEELKLSYVLPVDETWFVGSGIYLSGITTEFSPEAKDSLIHRVRYAHDYALAYGKEKAVAAFNDQQGQFAQGEAYIFAYDFNGTTLALPYQPEVLGSDRTGFTDTYGVFGVAWEIAVAEGGGGFVYITYVSPATGVESLKLCYVIPTGTDWLVGSGIYAGLHE